MADISKIKTRSNGIEYNIKDHYVRDIIATEFSSSTLYLVGDYCIYNGFFYICTVAHRGAWNASHFELTTVGERLKVNGRPSQTITADKSEVTLTPSKTSDTITISGAHTPLIATSSDTSTATVSVNDNVVTVTAVANGSAIVSIYAQSTTSYEQSNTISISVEVLLKAPLVAFETATDEQITAILNSFYDDKYTQEEITALKTTYWPIGAKRSISISAMSATGVDEAHHADTYQYVIIGHEHDTLVSAINGHTKALITLQQERIFYKNTTDTSYSSGYPSAEDEGGQMNSTNTNTTGWNTCPRRTWCNSVYKAALPQYIQNDLKQVYKSTANTGNTSSPSWIANTDYCFLLSEYEVSGSASGSTENGVNATHYINGTSGDSITMPKGGNKYPYFNTALNKYKLPQYGNNASCYWWQRSPYKDSATHFCIIFASGQANVGVVTDHAGIAPAFCL